MDHEHSCGYGVDHPFFWLGMPDEHHPISNNIHIAFSSKSREEVDSFYTAALRAGAKDNGAPGIRAKYRPNYYAAFVIDPNGYNIEVVFRE